MSVGEGTGTHPRARVVTDEDALAEVVASLLHADRYALDTEFHRERTYFPRLALVQLAWDDQIALVDPLAVDPARLAPVFEGPGVAVIHAASQDLEVLEVACGCAPASIFDTQVAGGFVGHHSASLGNLLEQELDVHLTKSDRLTDWLRRPLGEAQLRYAADDVAHLLRLDAHLQERLEERGRLQWALDECASQRARARGLRDPDDAWTRLKDARNLNGRGRAVAQAVAGWRERRAATLDQPARHVLSDLAISSIAQRPPKTIEELTRIRGVDQRLARGRVGEQLLAAIEAGLASPSPPRRETRQGLDPALRPVVTLVAAWVAQLARDLALDPALVATRSDLEELLGGAPGGRLSNGWRAALLRGPVDALLGGRAALAFSRDGTLALEVRSGQAFGPADVDASASASTTAPSAGSVPENG